MTYTLAQVLCNPPVETLIALNHDDASGDESSLWQGPASEMNSVEKDALSPPICRRGQHTMTPPAVHVGVIPVSCIAHSASTRCRQRRGITAADIRYRPGHVTTVSSCLASFAQTKRSSVRQRAGAGSSALSLHQASDPPSLHHFRFGRDWNPSPSLTNLSPGNVRVHRARLD